MWQVEGKIVRLTLHSGHNNQSFTEVGLRFARCVAQRHKHLPSADLRLAHVILHNRVAACIPVFFSQPLEDPLRAVPLPSWPALVFFQNGVDGTLPRTQLRPPHRLMPLIPGRRRKRQHLPHRLACQPELPRHFPLTPPLHMNCPPYPCIQFHCVHASGVPRKHSPLNGAEPRSSPLQNFRCPWNQNVAVVYFYSATSRRYRAAMWSIFSPALIGLLQIETQRKTIFDEAELSAHLHEFADERRRRLRGQRMFLARRPFRSGRLNRRISLRRGYCRLMRKSGSGRFGRQGYRRSCRGDKRPFLNHGCRPLLHNVRLGPVH